MSETLTIFGLKSCDTCRKAAADLRAAGKDVFFQDVRAEPLTPEQRALFAAALGEALVNRRSTTWRGLSETDRQGSADALLAAHPTLMKRPVIDRGGQLFLGWDAGTRAALLG